MILINKNYSAFVAFTACVLLSIATISPSFAQQPSQNKPKSNDKIVGIVDGCKSHKNYEDWLTEYGLAYKTVTNSAEAESCALIIFCGGPDLGIDTVRDKLDSLVYEECKNKNKYS